MKKTLRRIASACGLATLYFGSPSAHAFCTHFEIAGIGVNCVDEGHKKVTGYLGPFMRPEVWSVIWNGNYAQDNPFGSFANDGQRHFQSCLFRNKPYVVANIHYIDPGSIEYIRDTYSNAIAYLDPLDPEPLTAADRFGKLLHTVQDFYSHTNWINLLNLSAPNPVSSADLFENTLGEWPLIDWLGPVRDDIILGQVPANGFLPAGWSVTQSETSEIPIFTTPDGPRRGLITGWNETGACPDVREGLKVDDYSHLEILPIPRTNRLPHGESKIAGQTDFVHEITDGWKDAGYQAERPCHDGYPTYVCLQKDTPGRPDYGQAIQLAKLQTAQEWCRLLHLTNPDRSRTNVAVHQHAGRLYIHEATVPPDMPEPILFLQSLAWVNDQGLAIRYRTLYTEGYADWKFPQPAPPPVTLRDLETSIDQPPRPAR